MSIFNSMSNFNLRLFYQISIGKVKIDSLVVNVFENDSSTMYIKNTGIYLFKQYLNEDNKVIVSRGNGTYSFKINDLKKLSICIVQYGIFDNNTYYIDSTTRKLHSLSEDEITLALAEEVKYKGGLHKTPKYFRIIEIVSNESYKTISALIIANVLYDGYKIQKSDFSTLKLIKEKYDG